MRKISKDLSIPVDGKPLDFRLTKLDAFSGVSLLRMISGLPENASVMELFSLLPDMDLRSLMTTCLQHAEVLFPAGGGNDAGIRRKDRFRPDPGKVG